MTTIASRQWNAMPKEERGRLMGHIIERQILDIHIELRRAKTAYEKQTLEARAHLKNLEDLLSKWEAEHGGKAND